jgi:hypothetical protein
VRPGERSRTKSEGKTRQAVERDIREALHTTPMAQRTCARQPPSVFRVIAREIGNRRRLYSRPGNDLTWYFPPIAERSVGWRSKLIP